MGSRGRKDSEEVGGEDQQSQKGRRIRCIGSGCRGQDPEDPDSTGGRMTCEASMSADLSLDIDFNQSAPYLSGHPTT
jgi:hypothetical protein